MTEENTQAAPVAEFEELGTPAELAALYGALAKAQGEFTPINKSRTVTVQMKSGGKYTYDYAPMDELVKATRPALSKHGLSVLMPLSTISEVRLRVTLAHDGGARIRSLVVVPGADDIKDAGGNLTYLTRYAYRALLGLDGGEDADDKPRASEAGAEAAQRAPKNAEPRRAPETPQTQAKPANAQGQAAPKASTAQNSGAPSGNASSQPQTSSKPAAASAKSAPSQASTAPAGEPPKSATPPPPPASPAASPSPTSAPTAPAGETPLTDEQRANVYALLAKLGVAAPRAGAYLSSLMNRLGLPPKVTGENYERVAAELRAEAGG